jgi:hypothetical protein
MGDHILCNAIVRTYAEKYTRVYLFVKPQNISNVAYMYRDLKNFKPIALDDAQTKFFMRINPDNKYLIVGITLEWFKKLDNKEFETFDHGFYVAADVPFEHKWNKFYFQRDIEKEKDTYYNKLGLKDNENFIFMHDDPKNGRVINETYISKNDKIIKPIDYLDIGVFDFLYTIEKAKEIHCMDSSFSCLIDTIQLRNDNLFMHSYVRKDNSPSPKFKLKWKIIK